MRASPKSRLAFTLPELLVAAALSLGIMAIIAVAFQKGIDTFRTLRSVGVMQERLRSAQNVLKRDLSAEHFGGNFRVGYGGPYVRDQRLDLSGWTPPEEGFFSIHQGRDSILEASDGDQIPSYRAVCHSLHFTMKLTGKREEDFFYASAPPLVSALNTTANSPAYLPDFARNGQLVSRWAEVFYFVLANGDTANGEPLYTLYRRTRVILPGIAAGTTAPTATANNPEISTGQNGVVNTAETVTTVNNRMRVTSTNQSTTTNGGTISRTTTQTGTNQGDDILLTDVLSFEVKANWTTNIFNATSNPQGASLSGERFREVRDGNLDWPFDVFPASPRNNLFGANHRCFDTWSSTLAPANPAINWDDPSTAGEGFNRSSANRPPLRIRVNSLQIRIRIWDANAQQARQMTMVQEI